MRHRAFAQPQKGPMKQNLSQILDFRGLLKNCHPREGDFFSRLETTDHLVKTSWCDWPCQGPLVIQQPIECDGEDWLAGRSR